MAKRVTVLPLQGQSISGRKTGRGGRSWALAAAQGRDVPGFEVAVQFGWSYAWRMTNDGAGPPTGCCPRAKKAQESFK